MNTLALLAVLLEEAPADNDGGGTSFIPFAVAFGVILLLRFRPGRK